MRFVAFLVLIFAAFPVQARDLMVVGFGGGFQDNARKHLFQGYAAATGEAVKDDVYNGEQAKIAAQVRTKDVTWDVVMVEAPELTRGCEDGLFERIDWSVVKRPKFIPSGTTTCGAGAVGWGVALFYDANRIKAGPTSYAELWDLKAFPGKRSLRAGPKMTLEIALLADGVAQADIYKVLATQAGQDRAFAALDRIKPSIVWWKAGAQPLQFVASGEVAYAVGYVGRTARAAQDGANYPLLWKTLLYSFDYWAVVKGSPNTAGAMKLIDYMTDAKPLTALAQDWAVAPATASVADDPVIRAKNPGMVSNHGAEGLFIDTDFWVEHGDDLEKRFTAWRPDEATPQAPLAMRRWLLVPAVGLVLIVLIIPLVQILSVAVRDPAMRVVMPSTAQMLRAWDGKGLPDEAVFASAARELARAEAGQTIGGLAQRLNFERSGSRALLIRTARSALAAPYAASMVALDARWGEPEIWQIMQRASWPMTWLFLLRAVDLDLTPTGEIVAVPAGQAVFVVLFGRTLLISLGVTVICVVIAYPVAHAIAHLRAGWARLAMTLVLIPLWVSILVHTTAWFILLQREGPVNAALLALGIVDKPVAMMFTRFAVYLAMVHVLLPFAILPLVGVMRRVDPVYLRASASLGAPGWMGFARVYLPLTMPGVAAGAMIVFMLAIGFYVTPTLVGGPRDQMVSGFIAEYMNTSLNWSMAAALGCVLMVMVGVVVGVGRLLLFGGRRIA